LTIHRITDVQLEKFTSAMQRSLL